MLDQKLAKLRPKLKEEFGKKTVYYASAKI
jgi:hypothetical protein